PKGWAEFTEQLAQHDATGSANTMRGVQAQRPSIYTLEKELRALTIPALIISGDEDDHCLQPAIYLKQTLPASGLLILPKTGHTVNLEEPELFNRAVRDVIQYCEAGLWAQRDPRATNEIMKVS